MNLFLLKTSGQNIIFVLRKPVYFLLAAAATIATALIILWSLNIEVFWLIITNEALNWLDKLELIIDILAGVFFNFTSPPDAALAVFSLLFGVNAALLSYVIKRRGLGNIPRKSGLSGFMIAVIGGGCLACGTSIFGPLLATAGGASTAFFRDFSLALNLLGSGLIAYSIYKLAILISYKNKA